MNLELNILSSKVIEAAIEVHSELGPGLLESVYNTCVLMELREMNLDVKSEVPLPVFIGKRKLPKMASGWTCWLRTKSSLS